MILGVLGACADDGERQRNGADATGPHFQNPLSCSYDEALAAAHCGCDAVPPVDLAQSGVTLEVWPFGVHAQSGHTEGHRGLDFQTHVPDDQVAAVEVVAPLAGTIVDIDNAQDASGGLAAEFDIDDPAVHFTKLLGDCGTSVVLIPLALDPGIQAGVHVIRGQRLGVLARTRHSSPGTLTYSAHFEIDVDPGADPALRAVCPARLFSAEAQARIEAITAASRFDEKSARTVSIACESGASITVQFAAEGAACNPRLDAPLRATLAACLPSRADTIW